MKIKSPNRKEIKLNRIVVGNNTSLYMDITAWPYNIVGASLSYGGFYGKGGGSLTVKGTNLPWQAYTDEAIPGQIGTLFKKFLPSPNSKVGWSEQGMQENNAWNFDVFVPRK